jgi:penicillin-binding protein A
VVKKNKKLNHLPFRLNLLFLLTFMMFSVLIFRLGMVQIVDGEEYLAQAEQSTMRSVNVAAPRGWMMDRNGEVIVDNVPIYTITYTITPGLEQELEEVAAYLSSLIDVEPEDIIDQIDPELTYTPQPI